MPTPIRQARWSLAKTHPDTLPLARQLNISPTLAQLLLQLGHHTPASASRFLNPRLQDLSDPFLITDLERAVRRITQALAKNERITLYGDYDVDGITSTTILTRCLRAQGGNPRYFLPHRINEGYGLSQSALERCIQEHRPNLLIALDCGTTSHKEVSWLAQKGIDVIIIDHHELPPQLPSPSILVNPHRDGRLEYLCTAGLTFKVCHGLLKLSPRHRENLDLKSFLDLAATGTIADIVPLIGENRIIVHRGLQQLAQTRNLGLRALMDICRIDDAPEPDDIGFRIGPRLNASGRMADAILSLELLLTEDYHRAEKIAQELDLHNRQRQSAEATIIEEALQKLEAEFDPDRDYSIVLGSRGWHIGIIGIVAARIQRLYYRPTFVIGFDEEGMGKGSGRGIKGCSLVEGLRACSSYLTGFGGHEYAAGLTLHESNLHAFKEAFEAWTRSQLSPEHLQEEIKISAELRPDEVTEELYHEIATLRPFGRDNPEPIFLLRNIHQSRPPQTFGRNHLKLFIKTHHGELHALAFGQAHRPAPPENFSLIGTLSWDTYHDAPCIHITDWQNTPTPKIYTTDASLQPLAPACRR
ncbi:MAG: single-stranded-DNA-specific exonuclease RecJ [Methylacidiphilales bacterium]|nr:single-stranded-DNA-specific exonuclease RecJ [Candidatus Methylacidiphilales bacterium]MDW8349720.1 single-stranded-DNA-specific exonuclease RecJ [Verrucomicrobiae bacterium]